MSNVLRTAAVAAFLFVAACAAIVDAPAGPYKVANGYQVTLGRQWSDISGIMLNRPSNVRLLSIDGPFLNRLYLSDGLAAGGTLVKPERREQPTPAYRADMSPTEVMEFVADSVAALQYQRVETANPRPAQFSGVDAIRFDLTAKTKEGLDISGTAVAAERGGRLYVILYLAPSEHYFAAFISEVEGIMRSARLPG